MSFVRVLVAGIRAAALKGCRWRLAMMIDRWHQPARWLVVLVVFLGLSTQVASSPALSPTGSPPSVEPTIAPSPRPSLTFGPSPRPTRSPTFAPTRNVTWRPTTLPTVVPSPLPTVAPTTQCTLVGDEGFTANGYNPDELMQASGSRTKPVGSAGGRLFIKVKRATNLPDTDDNWYTSFIAGEADPYVRVTVGDKYESFTADSGKKDATLEPIWDEELDLHYHASRFEQITFQVMDYDTGFEGWDDVMGAAHMNVPFCSMFSTDMVEDTITCQGTLDDESDDPCAAGGTDWLMQTRKSLQQLWLADARRGG